MRIEGWSPDKFTKQVKGEAMKRLEQAAEVVAGKTRSNLEAQIGQGVTTGINRPVYKKGKYAGERWTGREFGQLLKSVRVSKREEKYSVLLLKRRNIRIYIGNYLAYYASIFEYTRPFLRPAFYSSFEEIRYILGVR